ncbi:MAG: hypothetical protein RMK57_10000 [Bryobacterales bacterium]|nr:hypothetical protein [Bryobacteraceae bacterium]MDW8354849.1 hypothetical protein [Bryobacterales bacterium]
MPVIGPRRYVEIPGDGTHELPPLLVRSTPCVRRLEDILEMAEALVESEELIPPVPQEDSAAAAERQWRKMDLALQLVEQYAILLTHWKWGDSVLEWIRQCEITFCRHPHLRPLLRPDVWPHAGRRSFVQLLADKGVIAEDVALQKAVGLRLTFRQPPPLTCFSDQFLFYLNSSVAASAFAKWAEMTPEPVWSLPPERFHFEVVDLSR